MKGDRLYLNHILECIRRIEEYTKDGRASFLVIPLVQDGVLRNLQILAESTQRLSLECKARCPDVPWVLIAGFRNILTHDYLGVDLESIWAIVETDVPALKSAIKNLKAD